jgi:hypothetical protein
MLSTVLGPAGGWATDAEHDDAPGRRIVMLYADPATQANLTAWAHAMGFDVGGPNPHEGHAFHVTLLATVNDVAIPLADRLIEPVAVVPIGCGVLGRDEDTPVMLLAHCDQLAAMRTHLVETYGAEPTFEFKPHISLSYNWDGEPDMRDRDLPDFDLVFDRLVVDAFEGEKAMSAEQKLFGFGEQSAIDEMQGLAQYVHSVLDKWRNHPSHPSYPVLDALDEYVDGFVYNESTGEGADEDGNPNAGWNADRRRLEEKATVQDRKGVLDWLLGKPTDAAALELELEELQAARARWEEFIAANVPADREFLYQDILNSLDRSMAEVRRRLDAIAGADESGEDDKAGAVDLQRMIADLEKAA